MIPARALPNHITEVGKFKFEVGTRNLSYSHPVQVFAGNLLQGTGADVAYDKGLGGLELLSDFRASVIGRNMFRPDRDILCEVLKGDADGFKKCLFKELFLAFVLKS